jgi:hypothetical protein
MATLAEFYSHELTTDLRWREAEIAIMRKSLYGTAIGSVQESAVLRACVAMVYAHYEGFCKFALNSYIDALEKIALKRKELSWPLAAYSMAKLRKKVSQIGDTRLFFDELVAKFNLSLEDVAEYDRPPQIANLWPDLLIEWLSKLDLDRSSVSSHAAMLELLVNNRNKIAHGQKLLIANRAEFDKYQHAATVAMHEVAVGIVQALDSKSYARIGTAQLVLNHGA